MTANQGNYLIAIMAAFVAVVGGTAWNIISFILHQYRVSEKEQDGLNHQIQALLRNSSAPLSFTQHVLECGWAWRSRARRPLLRTVSLAIVSVFIFGLFFGIGLLTSQLATSGDVLLRSRNCKQISLDELAQTLSLSDYELVIYGDALQQERNMKASLAYARKSNEPYLRGHICKILLHETH